jgi:nucleoside-diphosphate-sugar epimerase
MGPLEGGKNSVRVLVRPGVGASEMIGLGAQTVVGDIRDLSAVTQLVYGAEGASLFHVAGVIHPRSGTREFEDVNINGTRNLILAGSEAGLKRIVAMSSNSPTGASKNPAEIFDEESPYNPYMGYGRSKRAMEELLLAHKATSRLPEITIVRAPWFYGPGQPRRQTTFFTMIKQGTFPIMGRGEARRSLGYVDSLAHGMLLAALAPQAAGNIYWMADERPYPIYEIVDTVRAVLSEDFGIPVKPKTLHLPSLVSDIARVADRALQGASLYSQKIHVLSEMNLTIACSISKAKRDLGYRPLVSLREGMRRSVEWCLKRQIVI